LWYDHKNEKFFLQDTKSSNGTFVNNQRLSKASEESPAVEVNSCDIVQFGVDVVDSARKVTHGCIVSQLRLYMPNGQESKQSDNKNANIGAKVPYNSGYPPIQSQELYQLHQYIQEALHREQMLEQKLALLQRLVSSSHESSEKGWQALIHEDRLLSRLEFLENQIQVHKTDGEDEISTKKKVLLLQEEKYNYESTSKETLRQALQEKLEAAQKLSNLEHSLSNTEDEIGNLQQVHQQVQQELLDLVTTHQATVKEMQEINNKLQMSEHKRNQQDTELETLRQKVEKYKEAEELRLLLANTPCKSTSESGTQVHPSLLHTISPDDDDSSSIDPPAPSLPLIDTSNGALDQPEQIISATMKTLQSTLQLNEEKLEKFLQYFDRLFNHQKNNEEQDSTTLIDIQECTMTSSTSEELTDYASKLRDLQAILKDTHEAIASVKQEAVLLASSTGQSENIKRRLDDEIVDDIFGHEEESLKKSSAAEEELNTKISILQEEVMVNCLEISHLKDTLQVKETEISESSTAMIQLQTEISQKDSLILCLQEENMEIDVLRDQCNKEKDQTATLNSCISEITTERDQLRADLSSKDDETTQLSSKISEMEQRLAELTTQLSEKNEEINSLKQETEVLLNQSVEKEKEQQEQWSSILSQKEAEIDQVTSRCRQLILDREAKANAGSPMLDTIVKVMTGLFLSFLFYLLSTYVGEQGGGGGPSTS